MLSDCEIIIWRAVLGHIRRFHDAERALRFPCSRDERLDHKEFRQWGIPYNPSAWLDGPLDDAERQQMSRAAAGLEQRGLLERVSDGRRTTHIRPTAAGVRVAIQATGAEPDAAQGLRIAEWWEVEE